MTELLIRYQGGSGNLSERRISKIEVQDSNYILAYCHQREEDRTFKISRIASAIDPETGEVIEDLYSFLGVQPPAKPIPPGPQPIPVGTEAVKRLRNKEKGDLFKPFLYGVIEDWAKKRFFSFFGDVCFKCGSYGPLVMDHHVPIILGGHLVSGNLVALCPICNNRKGDTPPEAFYTKGELERLQGFLDNQHSVFAFSFDQEAWEANREEYLRSLGIDDALAHEVLHNPDHRFHIPPPSEPTGVTITIDDSILSIIRKVLADKVVK